MANLLPLHPFWQPLRICLDCLLAPFHRIELLLWQRTKCTGKCDSLKCIKLAREFPFLTYRAGNPVKNFSWLPKNHENLTHEIFLTRKVLDLQYVVCKCFVLLSFVFPGGHFELVPSLLIKYYHTSWWTCVVPEVNCSLDPPHHLHTCTSCSSSCSTSSLLPSFSCSSSSSDLCLLPRACHHDYFHHSSWQMLHVEYSTAVTLWSRWIKFFQFHRKHCYYTPWRISSHI